MRFIDNILFACVMSREFCCQEIKKSRVRLTFYARSKSLRFILQRRESIQQAIPRSRKPAKDLHVRPGEMEDDPPLPVSAKPAKPKKKNKLYTIHPNVEGFAAQKAQKAVSDSGVADSGASNESKSQTGDAKKDPYLSKQFSVYVKGKGCLVGNVTSIHEGLYSVEFADGSVSEYSPSELKWNVNLAKTLNHKADSGSCLCRTSIMNGEDDRSCRAHTTKACISQHASHCHKTTAFAKMPK